MINRRSVPMTAALIVVCGSVLLGAFKRMPDGKEWTTDNLSVQGPGNKQMAISARCVRN